MPSMELIVFSVETQPSDFVMASRSSSFLKVTFIMIGFPFCGLVELRALSVLDFKNGVRVFGGAYGLKYIR